VNIRLLALLAVLALEIQGCAGRECSSHVTEGAYSQHCQKECLSHEKYYRCNCDRNCLCWDYDHPGSP
jgi:hypothetical protein